MSANTSPDSILYPLSTDQVSPLATVLANMANSVQTALNGQGKYYSRVVADQAARTAAFPSPVQGNRVFRNDKGWEEAYFALYNATTNTGGATPAGWYPMSGNLPIGIVKRTATGISIPSAVYTNVSSNAGWSSTLSNGGVLRGGMTYTDGFVVPIGGVYNITWQVQLSGTPNVVIGIGLNQTTTPGGEMLYATQSIVDAGAKMGSGSALIVLAPGDKLTMWVYANGGVATINASGKGPAFSVAYQGPAQ